MKMHDVDFLIIGAAKSATTWLQAQLQAASSIYMPDPELHYFSRKYARGEKWYIEQFKTAQGTRLVGEKSNSYLSDPKAANRIHNALPNIKLIAQLRNPIDRAYSDYCMLFRRGEVGPDIENYLDPNKATENRFLNDGNYAHQLQPYIDLFGKDCLLVLDFQNVAKHPKGQINAMCQHLDFDISLTMAAPTGKVKDKTIERISPQMRKQLSWLKPMVKPFRQAKAFRAVWASLAKKPEYPVLPPKLRNIMQEYYSDTNAQLEKITDWSIDHWS